MKYKKRNWTECVNFHVVLPVVIVITTGYIGCSVNRLPES